MRNMVTNPASTPAKYRLAKSASGVIVMCWQPASTPGTGWWTPVARFQTADDALLQFPTAHNGTNK